MFIVLFVYAYSLIPVAIAIISTGGNKQRRETRLKMFMSLPITSRKIIISFQLIEVGFLLICISIWMVIAFFGGVTLDGEKPWVWLIMNAFILGMVIGTSLSEQFKASTEFENRLFTILGGGLFVCTLSVTAFREILISFADKSSIAPVEVARLLNDGNAILMSQTGAFVILIMVLLLPFVTVWQFTRRQHYMKRP